MLYNDEFRGSGCTDSLSGNRYHPQIISHTVQQNTTSNPQRETKQQGREAKSSLRGRQFFILHLYDLVQPGVTYCYKLTYVMYSKLYKQTMQLLPQCFHFFRFNINVDKVKSDKQGSHPHRANKIHLLFLTT